MTDNKNYIPKNRAITVERELKLTRAVEAYRMFYPSVSCWSFFEDIINMGMIPNKKHIYCHGTADKKALTPNSDTPYAVALIDATEKPVVLELPAGAIMGVLNDWYFQETGNVGLPGPDKGQGGKYLIVGPEYKGEIPSDGYYIVPSETNHCLAAIRAVPQPAHPDKAMELLSSIKTYLLGEKDQTEMVDVTSKTFAVTSSTRDETLDYWRAVHEIINKDVQIKSFYMEYGRLAAAGIQRGKPFPEDKETLDLLMEASKIAAEQMRVESLSSQREDRLVWKDRTWEWAALVIDSCFLTEDHMDLYARDRWFFQATLNSRKMFPRKAGVGSIYLLGVKDKNGDNLDGSKNYKLHIPASIPAGQFWSMTVYSVKDRSEILTDMNKAALSSLSDKFIKNDDGSIDLYVGPDAPKDLENQWIKSIPGEGWFTYFRLYGPGEEVFDGKWVLDDFQLI